MYCQPVEEVEMKHEHPKLGTLQDGKADVCADIHHNQRTERVTKKLQRKRGRVAGSGKRLLEMLNRTHPFFEAGDFKHIVVDDVQGVKQSGTNSV